MHRDTWPIGSIKVARKGFEKFRKAVRDRIGAALTIAAEGRKADIAGELWVVHAFQRKSKSGIKTPKFEVDLIRDRLKRLGKELLQ
jgi:phage-related protein